MNKKQVREKFRNDVFKRDKNECAICGDKWSKLDAHHITNRNEFENGGYVLENGVTLCDKVDGCHFQAEKFLQTRDYIGASYEITPDGLYELIGSSFEKAVEADKKLKQK